MKHNTLYNILVEEDSNGLCHNIPNARYDKWKINSLGFRGKEIGLEKEKGKVRIVCLGTSETFGFYESEGKEWPSQLGERLKETFPNVEVINVSVVGLGLKRNKEYIEKYVLPLKPDILLVPQTYVIYTKDLMRGVMIKSPSSKHRMKKAALQDADPCALPIHQKLWGGVKVLKRFLPESLLDFHRMRRLRSRLRKKEKKHLKNKKPSDRVPENTIFEFKEDLRDFIDYLRKNRILPVLSTFPTLTARNNKDSYKGILLSTRLTFCVELSEDGIIDAGERANQAARKIAEENDVPFIDNDRLIPKTLEYFGDNYHYTDKGSFHMAENFYHVLVRSKLIA